VAECLIIGSEQWGELMRALGAFFLLAIGMGWLGHFDLALWEWRIRRHLRRRRIARIRGASNGR